MENIYNSWLHFQREQNQSFKNSSAKHWLGLIQDNTEQWKEKKYPTGESWKYVNFRQLPQSNLHIVESDQVNSQSADENFYCFEISNFSDIGNLQKSYLPIGLEVLTQSEEINKYPDTPLVQLFNEKKQINEFAKSALSFIGLGLVFRLQGSCQLDKPIKLIFDLDKIKDKDALSVYNVFIEMKKKSKAQIFFEIRAESFTGLANFRVDMLLEQGSELSYHSKETGGGLSHIVSSVHVKQYKETGFKSFDFTLPGLWSRHNLQVDLLGEQAKTELKGAYLNNNNFFSDHHTEINHFVGETYSQEDYRGILSDSATAVFNGKVFIEKKAAKANSEQINKNLMLSKEAEVNTKPELQIYNDDVKAAHGATVGKLDEEQRFYLQSRGYSDLEALHTLTKAFIFDLVESESKLVKDFFVPTVTGALKNLKEN